MASHTHLRCLSSRLCLHGARSCAAWNDIHMCLVKENQKRGKKGKQRYRAGEGSKCQPQLFKNHSEGWERAQWLKPGLLSSSLPGKLQGTGSRHPPLALGTPHICTDIHTGKTPTHIFCGVLIRSACMCACVSFCVLCACKSPEARRRLQLSCTWGYKWS